MRYTGFTKKPFKDHHQILFEGNEKDTTGLGGTWNSGGTFASVYEVGKFLVMQNPLNQKPFAVFTSWDEIEICLNKLLENGTKIKITEPVDRVKQESDPVRFMAFSAGLFRE